MAFILGLTGGIGSGKSAATNFFKTLGIDIIDADLIAREVVSINSPALEDIRKHFGDDILYENGELNRAVLRDIIFNDALEKAWLEDLLHPQIRDIILKKTDNVISPYGILVSPLLFETQQNDLTDRSLLIDVPEDIQLQRVMARDNNTQQQVKNIINSQLSRKEKQQRANDIIINDGSLTELEEKLFNYHQQLLKDIQPKQ